MLQLRQVAFADHIDQVVVLAEEIWSEHFTPIIGPGQVEYMLAEFQSAAAIASQIDQGYEYLLIEDDDVAVGYVALVPDTPDSIQISKLYIKREFRRRGLATGVVDMVERSARECGVKALSLVVNKGNSGAIAFYERSGFIKTGELVTDIGGGFFQDDYRMAKALDRLPD